MTRQTPREARVERTGRLGAMLSKLGICAHDRLSERLEPLGLQARHFELLRLLSASEGAPQQQLADAMGLHRNQMVKLLDDLQARELVERRPHPDDRRAHALMLTPSAKTLLSTAQQAADDDELDFTASLSPEEARELARLLEQVADHAGVDLSDLSTSPNARPRPKDSG